MKKILILGSGAGGTMVASKLRRELSEAEWKITIIDHDEIHHYQPGWLFIPFGIYGEEDCIKPKRDFIPPGVIPTSAKLRVKRPATITIGS